MHILYIHQYFKTPEEGGAIRSYYLAKGLVDAGHKVTMLTSYPGTKYKKMFVDGIHVHYLPVPYQQSMGKFARLRAFLTFVWLACRKAPRFKKADLCYLTSTPLTVGLVGLYLRRQFRMPFYFEVRDLWPEAPVQMQLIKSKLAQRVLYRLEKQIYEQANALVALSPGIEQYIRRIVPQKPVYLIPNMADCRFFSKSERNVYHEKQFEVENKFVVTYFGAMGRVNHLEYFLDAARACQQKQLRDVQFLMVGEGSELDRIKAYAQRLNLGNVRFIPHQNKYGLLSVLNITDAAYVSFADLPVLQTNSPNKFFDALAAGKLCITNTRGWTADLVEEHHCGFYAAPHRPEEFVARLAPFVNDRQLLDTYQTNARLMGEQQFERDQQVGALLDSLGISRPLPQRTTADTLPA